MEVEDLSNVLFFNILPRLPVKSLMQFRSVSKSWRESIDDPLLAHISLPISAENPGLLILMQNSKASRFYLAKEDSHRGRFIEATELSTQHISSKYTLEALCNGLLCFVRYRESGNEIIVCNPLRKDVRILTSVATATTDPSKQLYGLGYSRSSREFKLLQISVDRNFHTKIYSMKTKSWKEVARKPPYPIHGRPVYADGALHWKLDTRFSLETDYHIVSFDLEREEFEIKDHPRLGSEKRGLVDVIELQGNLCLVDSSFSTHVEIWMLKEKQWVREYTIGMKVTGDRTDNRHVKIIGLWRNGDVFFSLSENSYFSYDPKSDLLEGQNVVGLDPDFELSEIFAHTWSLLPLDDTNVTN